MADEAKAALIKAVDDRIAAKAKAVQEQADEHGASTPTPTQRECDLAKVGALDIDAKEDDGSPSEVVTHSKMLAARDPSQNPYVTRDAAAERPRKAKATA